MGNEAKEYFDQLILLIHSDTSLINAYKVLRELFNRIFVQQEKERGLQLTGMVARISYLAARYDLSLQEVARLNRLRLTSNAVLDRLKEPCRMEFLQDMETVALTIQQISGITPPAELQALFSPTKPALSGSWLKSVVLKKMRVCFQYADGSFLYVLPCDAEFSGLVKVRYDSAPLYEDFADTIKVLWRHAQLNLLDVVVDEEGVVAPGFIVLEPDYLIDISALAECFKAYGNHPFNYLLNRLMPVSQSRAILIGNIANLFLDEWIYAEGEISYLECMKRAFRRYPVELAACEELTDPGKEKEFFNDCRVHFNNIRQTVQERFNAPEYALDKSDAVLEPSYICESLGIQGRLDYMQRNMRTFIEMKSGKADEYSDRDKMVPKKNHRIQMLLYQAVLEYSMGMEHENVHPYLLYTRYPLLYSARSSTRQVKKSINLRNLIVYQEYNVQLQNDIGFTAEIFRNMGSDRLNVKQLKGRYWEEYLKPGVDLYFQYLRRLSCLEQSYFYALYNFLVKEQYILRSGNMAYEGKPGASSLWLSTFTEKCEAGEIFYDLTLKESTADHPSSPRIIFELPLLEQKSVQNFRVGDAVVFYQRNRAGDNVTNKMIFKGSVEALDGKSVVIALRFSQRNRKLFSRKSKYAVEHDTMDGTLRSMFNGLTTYLYSEKTRRELLLMQRLPEVDKELWEKSSQETDDFKRIALKACAARDLFILIGPPGTGKTSRALKAMVEEMYGDRGNHLLLMAYTNRAVDEICKMLASIPEMDFIRIGNERACAEEYREFMLENNLKNCQSRLEVRSRLEKCRIIVGTVASISGKPELFRLKYFNTAIVDEASQVLEPQLLPVWCATGKNGKSAVGKFILIGDHKQLPAVVAQSAVDSAVREETLCSIGMMDLKESLFERLYRFLHHSSQGKACTDILEKQGRMHPGIAEFPGKNFYGGKLKIAGLPHQMDQRLEVLNFYHDGNHFSLSERVHFIPCKADRSGHTGKVNRNEAKLVASIIREMSKRYGRSCDLSESVGVITPYRNQIALIREELLLAGVQDPEEILVDTVERFQGSERDYILYSTSVNYPHQMNYLSSILLEDGCEIDRKLNVAITRARKQLIVLGVEEVLRTSKIYDELIGFARYPERSEI